MVSRWESIYPYGYLVRVSTWCNAPGIDRSNSNRTRNRTMSIDVKYDTTPCDGTPGQPWEDFKRRLRNVATGSDDRGFSLADHFDDIDEGGAAIGAPAMPANATELRKAQAARRRRQKDSYGLLTKHLLHKEHLQHITRRTSSRTAATHTNNYFDNALSQQSPHIEEGVGT